LLRKGEFDVGNREHLKAKINVTDDGIADRDEWFRRGLISAEARDLDVKRFENQKGTPQVLRDVMNGVPIKVPDGVSWGP
jgi:hypothetical protein